MIQDKLTPEALRRLAQLQNRVKEQIRKWRRMHYLVSSDDFSDRYDAALRCDDPGDWHHIDDLVRRAECNELASFLKPCRSVAFENMSGRKIRAAAKNENLYRWSRRLIDDLRAELIRDRDQTAS